MQRMYRLYTTIFLLIFFSAGKAFPEDGKAAKIQWIPFAEAIQKAKAENKMVVVDFYTDWCSACKLMEKNTYENSNVVSFAQKKLIMTKVNAESNDKTSFRGQDFTYRQLALGFGVRAYPTTIFITPQGEFLTNIEGYIPADSFIPILEYLDGKHYETMKFDEFMAKREAK
ncbi:MAG: thioredoxin fold domain-containing protein [Deferribacteres bacterium]|nr:thioredoxin fold domain-containing protein [candidate division KSB1 bacterium]MCB9508672.1 thioredoxin fold domain-containing protein [Deferribacteres bacterium]